jgi:hypothetical protein
MSQKVVLLKKLNDYEWEAKFHTCKMAVVHESCLNESHVGNEARIELVASGVGSPSEKFLELILELCTHHGSDILTNIANRFHLNKPCTFKPPRLWQCRGKMQKLTSLTPFRFFPYNCSGSRTATL